MRAHFEYHSLGIQTDPNCDHVPPKQTPRRRIRDAAGYLTRQPALPLTRIVIRQQICCASAPASTKSSPQLHPHARILRNIANISGFRSVLGHDPKLIANASVADGSTPRLSCLATNGL